jgi:hypothetical protein
MGQKSWVISYASSDTPDKKDIIEHLSNRKKITQVEEYMLALYGEIMAKEMPDTPFSPAWLNGAINRKSGTETVLEKAPYVVYAELVETDI